MDRQLEDELTELAHDAFFTYARTFGGADLKDYEIDFENRTIRVVYRPYNEIEETLDF